MSATDEPDTPEKITDEMTLTWPRPPGSQPTMASAKSKMRSATLPRSMTAPTRMNSGTATSRNEFIDENMVCVSRSSGIGVNSRQRGDAGQAERDGERHAEHAHERRK